MSRLESGRAALLVPLLAIALVAGGCVASDPAWTDPVGDRASSGSGLMPTSSSRLMPEARREPGPRPLPSAPRTGPFPALDAEALAALEIGMTAAEVHDLLGEPDLDETRQVGADREEGDWNARVWTYRVQDELVRPLPMPRDLELRFAFTSVRDHALGRSAVPGPDWVLTGWDLW